MPHGESPRRLAHGWRAAAVVLAALLGAAAAPAAAQGGDVLAIKFYGTTVDLPPGRQSGDEDWLSQRLGVNVVVLGHARDGAIRLRIPGRPDPARNAELVRRARLLPGVLYADMTKTSAKEGRGAPAAKSAPGEPAPATGRVVVRFRQPGLMEKAGRERAESLLPSLVAAGGQALSIVRLANPDTVVLALLHAIPRHEADLLAERLAQVPQVAHAEAEGRAYALLTTATDGLFSSQWNLIGTHGINISAAWDYSTGNPAIAVAVVDSGRLDHADLVGRWGNGTGFVTGGLAPDSAYDLGGYGGSCPGGERPTMAWHGTRVAGIIGATANNGNSIAGINWNSKMLPVRTLGPCGAFPSDVGAAIKWAAGIPVDGSPVNATPAKVINLSLGGTSGSCPDIYQDAINAALARGAVVVVAAGNGDLNGVAQDAGGYAPANCSGVITVAASNPSGTAASYSNFGSTVDLVAPGGQCPFGSCAGFGIRSTTSTQGTTGPWDYLDEHGTSFAAPQVSGVASLILSLKNLSPGQVKTLLETGTTPTPTCTNCMHGRLNAGAALQGVAGVTPGVVGSLDSQFAGGSVVLPVPPGYSTVAAPVANPVIVSGGNILLAYAVRTSGGIQQVALARVRPDGQFDPSFGVNGVRQYDMSQLCWSSGANNSHPEALLAVANNKVLLSVATTPRSGLCVVRLDEGGELDTTFGSSGVATATYGADAAPGGSHLGVQADGKIYALRRACFSGNAHVARFSAVGLPDTGWGPSGVKTFTLGATDCNPGALIGMTVESDGRLYLSGPSGSDPENFSGVWVRRYLAGGTDDSGFGTSGRFGFASNTARAGAFFKSVLAVVQGSNVYLLMGTANGATYRSTATSSSPLSSAATVVRTTAAGGLDAAFGTGGYRILDLADPRPDANGSFLAGVGLMLPGDGNILAAGPKQGFRLTNGGALDTGFALAGRIILDFSSQANADHAVLASTGRMLVAGTLSSAGSTLRAYAARFVTGDQAVSTSCYILDPVSGTCALAGSLGLGNRSVGSDGAARNSVVFRNDSFTTRLTLSKVFEQGAWKFSVTSDNNPGEFTYYSDTCEPPVLEPRQACVIYIDFAPKGTQAGQRTGSLYINTDSAQGVVRIPLLGQATASYRLTLARAGDGLGRVTSSPAGIDCTSPCSATFDAGSQVTLSALPGAGSSFSGWSGCAGTGSCTVTMDGDKTVTATFNLTQVSTGSAPVFQAQTRFGNSAAQRAWGLSAANGLLFVAGTQDTSGELEGFVARYTLPLAQDAADAGSPPIWPGKPGPDELFGVAATTGGVYVAGLSEFQTTDSVGGEEFKGITLKYNLAGGSPVWERQTPPAPGAFPYGGLEQARGVATAVEATQTYAYVAGLGQVDGSNQSRFFIAKLDSAGLFVWKATDGAEIVGNAPSAGRAVATLDGFVYGAGWTRDDGFPRPMLRKYSASGVLQWVRRSTDLTGEYNGAAAFNGAIYAVGTVGAAGPGSKFLVEKWDAAGNRLWSRTFERASSSQDSLQGIVALGTSVYAAGFTHGQTAGGADAIILEIDPATGTLLTSTLRGSSADDKAYAIATDGTDLYLAGETAGFGASGVDALVMRFSVTGGSDTTPAPFTFQDVTGVAPSTLVVSNAITVAGITAAAPISVAGGEYSIGGGPYTSAAGTVSNGQTVTVRHTSGAGSGATTSTTLTIGGVSDTFTSTTVVANDTTPDPFAFPMASGVATGTVVVSDSITVTGITALAPISVAGGEYSISGAAFTSAAGTVANGQTVRVRHTSAATNATSTSTTLTIGGVNGTFTSVTAAGGAAGSIAFASEHLLGTPTDERANAVAVVGGAVYIAGYRTTAAGDFDGLVARYDLPLSGTPAWSATWPTLIGEDIHYGLAVTGEGVYTAGSAWGRMTDTVGGKENKGAMVKYPLSGPTGAGFAGTTWEAQMPPPPGAFAFGGGESLTAAVAAREGNQDFVYAVGYGAASFDNYCRFFIVKVNAAGAMLWKATDEAEMVANGCTAGTGLALLNGHAYGVGGSRDGGTLRPMLRKYDAAGNLVWTRRSLDLVGDYRAVAAFGNAIYAVGQTGDGDSAANDFLVEKWDEGGTRIWSRKFDRASTQDNLYGVVGAANSIFAVGATRTANAGFDAAILEIDPVDGNLVRTTLRGGALDDRAFAVATDGSSLFVAGDTRSAGAGLSDAILMRFALTVPDTTPDAFSFETQAGVATSTVVTSNSVTITGINGPAPISVTGGLYSIDGAAFTSAPGTINNGQSVRVQHTSSTAASTSATTTLAIGGASGSFVSLTLDTAGGGSLVFGAAVFFGGGNDQHARAATVGSGALLVAGFQAVAGGEEADGMVARYALPLAPGAQPSWFTTWPNTTGADLFLAMTAGADSLYAAGSSFGRTTDTTGTKQNKGVTVKLPHTALFGGITWERQTPSAPGAFAFGGSESAQGIAVSTEAGQEYLYAVGFGQANAANECRFFITKMTAAGTVVWTRTDESEMASGGCTSGTAVTLLDGFAYAAGESREDKRPLLRKYDAAGNLAWTRRSPDANGSYAAVAAFSGAIYAAGRTGEGETAGNDFLIEKWDAAGNRVWKRVYDRGGSHDSLTGVVGAAGAIFAVGTTRGNTSGGLDAIVLEIDPADGALLKSTLYGGGQDERAFGVAADACSLYVVGDAKGAAFAGSEAMILQYAFTSSAACPVNPGALAFGGQSMGTISPPRALTFRNTSGSSVSVHSISMSNPQFRETNDCTILAPGASCTIRVSFAPSVQPGEINARHPVSGALSIVASVPSLSASVALSGIAEKSLVSHYYRSILGREPDAGGQAYWEAEAARIAGLGIDAREVWFAMTLTFLSSPEYQQRNTSDTQYLTDLYRTFFTREPDSPGLAYWQSHLSGGMDRGGVLSHFLFSPEFAQLTTGIFGAPASVRPEVDMTMDFYRGILGRLPDEGGFLYWRNQLRNAQCQGREAVTAKVAELAGLFTTAGEYGNRELARPPADRTRMHVGDLYNAFMRRGGDLEGYNFWVNEITSGRRTRETVRVDFVYSLEFQRRVTAVINAGCLP